MCIKENAKILKDLTDIIGNIGLYPDTFIDKV